MLKVTVLNNKIFMHAIDKESLKDVYISYTQFYNLIQNFSNVITIKKAIEPNNPKNYKPREETIAKLYNKNKKTYLKVATGKNYQPIQSVADISDSFEIQIENYEIIKNFVVNDFEKFEEYEELKKKLKQNYTKNSKIKELEDF